MLRPKKSRPKKPLDQKQNHIIKLSLNSRLYEVLSSRSRASRTPLASFCRTVLAGSQPPKVVPEINYEAYRELGKPLGNLHQILRLLYAARDQKIGIPSHTLELLESELSALKQVRFELLGISSTHPSGDELEGDE